MLVKTMKTVQSLRKETEIPTIVLRTGHLQEARSETRGGAQAIQSETSGFTSNLAISETGFPHL